MEFRGLFLAAFAVAALGLAPAAQASAIKFTAADTHAREWAIVDNIYGKFLREHPQAKVETAVVDLAGKGIGSVFVRFTDPAACSGDVCSTTVVHYSDRTGWRQVFSRRTKAISTGGPSAHPNGDVLATLIADGGETWEFTGVRYEPVVDSLGVPFPAPKTASGAHAQAAAEMLKDSLPPASLNLPVQFTEAQLDIGARGGAALLLEVQGGYSCGQGGCPFVLAVPDGNALQPVLSWVTIDQGAVLRTSSHGLHDLALRDREGFAVYRYDGKSYRLAATSYPSAVTPAP